MTRPPTSETTAASPATPTDPSDEPTRFLRIQEAAEAVGVTPRAIRYYEEQGLLAPAARSEGAYRLFDESDVDRLRFIRALRDDAGFSLAQIRQLLEDDAVRERNRIRFHATHDPKERRAIVLDSLERVDRQIATLGEKARRIAEMIAEAERRRAKLLARLAELEAGQ